MKFKTSTESAMACDSADKLLLHLRDNFQDFHSMMPMGASCPLCSACDVAYTKKPPWDEPSGLTPHAASLKTPKLSCCIGIAWMLTGRLSSRCACLMILLAFCKLSMVGLAVSLADNETFAAKSILEFVAIH